MARVETKCPSCGTPTDIPGAAGACPQCGAATAPAPAKRRGRSAILAGVALAAIGAAGVVIYLNFPTDLFHNNAGGAAPSATSGPPSKQEVSGAPDEADVRTRLVVTRGGAGGGRGAVALGRPVGPDSYIEGTRKGILLRELVRQAVLIAARDELGMTTRDELLDDLEPGAAGKPAVELSAVFRPGASRMLLRRDGGGTSEVLLKVDLGPNPNSGEYASQLAERLERLSRKEFVAALKGLGAEGKANPVREGAAVPAEVEERLSSLGLVEHFAAVRDLHAAIRADGESAERLGALARAYAQLGVLTEFHWSPAHKAFKARAMLYAERRLSREPGTARGLRDRAFVRALVGNHAEALRDLDEAEKAGAKAAGPAPAWAGVIDAYCRCDPARLKAVEGPHARLAALLRMMALEFPQDTRAAVLAARDAASADADCYRAYDVICESGQLGDLHVATVAAPEALARLLPAKLKAIEALPKGARSKLDGEPDGLGAVAALAGAAAGDGGEPSWGLLAHLVRETRFVQVFRRLVFMRNKWAVPVDEFWAEARPYVADHRYRPYLDTMALPPREAARSFGAFLDGFDPTDLETTERYLTDAIDRSDHPRVRGAWGIAVGHGDLLARDFAWDVTGSAESKAIYARNLLRISPYNPFAMAKLVELDWNGVKGEVSDWRGRAGGSAALLLALGRHDAGEKRFDEAIGELSRSVELSPDRAAYQALAACYEAKGDVDRWKATLDDFLTETEDAGLEHARVRVQIANDYMSRGQFAEAKPYAEAAAETWAGWAMTCAAQCEEGLGDWEQAELWTRRTTERYPNSSWPSWYLFCKRTGRGDVAAARVWTDGYLAAVAGRDDLADPDACAHYYWSTGALKKALDAMNRVFDAKPTAAVGIHLAFLADEAGDKARRDAVLARVCDELRDQAPKSTAICALIRSSLADGGEAPLDLKAVDAILESIPAQNRGNTEFFVGKYLMNHGQPAAGRKYLRRCADSASTYFWLRPIAADAAAAPDPPKEL